MAKKTKTPGVKATQASPRRKGAQGSVPASTAPQPGLPMRTERNAAEEVDRMIENGTAMARGVPGALLLDANYRRYAEMVVLGRAIPDARDGMKPVHRRILYDMLIELGLNASGPHKKSARVVGDVLGKFHPHGDKSVYDAMVILAQDFSMRLPLIDGQGNFGSQDGDSAAAMRYTEARLSHAGEIMLADIKSNTVDFQPNFDGSLDEPIVLPTRIPNLLINGSNGIAVGMATSIPPHNVGEVCDAVTYVANRWDAREKIKTTDLMKIIPGPDYPTGGVVYRFREDKETGEPVDVIYQAYDTGKAVFVVQAAVDIQEIGGGKSEIIVTEIPFQVWKSTIKDRIADNRDAFRNAGVANVADQSDRKGMRLVLETVRGFEPANVLQFALDKTQLRDSQSYNAVALVRDPDGRRRPQTCSLRTLLTEFVNFRLEVIVRRSKYELERAEARLHIVAALLKAINDIDAVIKIIRTSADVDDARKKLMKRLDIDEIQANAILDMQLRRLARLEYKKLDDERKELEAKIKELKAIIGSEKKRLEIVVTETKEIKDRFATPRKTTIIDSEQGHKAVVTGPIAAEGPQVLIVSDEGVRTEDASGFKDKVAAGTPSTRAVEVIAQRFLAEPEAKVVLISAGGRLWKGSVARLTQGLQLEGDQLVYAGLADPTAKIVLATLAGNIKRVNMEDALKGVEASWAMIIGLDEEDQVVFAGAGSDEAQIFLYSEGATGESKMLRFPASAVNPQATPSARGMAGIKLPDGEAVRGGMLFEPGSDKKAVVLMTTEGLIRRVGLDEFPVQGRAGQGVQILKVSDATGPMAGAALLASDSTVDIYSVKSKRLRLEFKEVPSGKRAHPGVSLRKQVRDLFGGESLMRVVALEKLR
ncbi:MAG: DNA topoisomerase 4 subunit A [Anaerolineales bacterium]|nr:DNA topoisomerase 4 subunit A [Anaerolineales bacterium]